MGGWFHVDADRRRSLLMLTMGGFFDADAIGEMRQGLDEALARLDCAPNEHVTLCDITDMNIQSQEMVACFTSLVGSRKVRSRRLAFITGTTLARLQARRLTSRPGVEFFIDRNAALAWLCAADDGVDARADDGAGPLDAGSPGVSPSA